MLINNILVVKKTYKRDAKKPLYLGFKEKIFRIFNYI